MFACVCLVSSCGVEHPVEALLQLAGDFSPRFEMVRPHVVLVEIGGLGRLLGTPRDIGAAFCRVALDRGMLVSVGIAATHTAALLLAMHPATLTPSPSDPVLVVVSPGREATALSLLPLSLLAALPAERLSNDDVMYLRRRRPRGDDDADRNAEPHDTQALPDSSAHSPPDNAPRSNTPQSDAPGKTRGWRGRGYSQHYRLAPAPLPAESSSTSSSQAAPPAHGAVTGADSPGGDSSRKRSSAAGQASERAERASGLATGERSGSGSTSRAAVWGSAAAAWEHAVHPASAFEPSVDERRDAILEVLRRWGLKTLGELARLPAADVFTRLGGEGLALQQIARGRDARPLIPTTADEPFEATLALEWPIDALEPLSFVLTRLFEPLCARLERCDRGAAVLQVSLQLVTRRTHIRRLELPAPMRDPKVLRTLVLLDLESHPPDAGIDRLTIAVDPTPGRIVQHSLLMRALPSPEQLSTLTARLTAVMGEGRVGAPMLLDTYRPEAFDMRRFEVDDSSRQVKKRTWTPAPTSFPSSPPRARSHAASLTNIGARVLGATTVAGLTAITAVSDTTAAAVAAVRSLAPAAARTNAPAPSVAGRSPSVQRPSDHAPSDHASSDQMWTPPSASDARYVLRRFRRAIPARVRVEEGRPVHVTPQGLPGAHVIQAAGPWRTSGEWWQSPSRLQPTTNPQSTSTPQPTAHTASSGAPVPTAPRRHPSPLTESWDRDEWDVALSDGSLYRIHLDHRQDRWFAEAELD